jgi:hypothetical protein
LKWWRSRGNDDVARSSVEVEVRSGPRGERVKTVAVRLTPEEYAVWVEAAAADGRGQMGRWVRESVMDHLAGRPAGSAGRVEGVGELRAELSRVGSNLNQVARALNVARRGGGEAPEMGVVVDVIEATRLELGRVRDELAGLG